MKGKSGGRNTESRKVGKATLSIFGGFPARRALFYCFHKKDSELPGLAVNGCDETVGLRVVEGVLRVVVGQGLVRPGSDVADVCILGAEAAGTDSDARRHHQHSGCSRKNSDSRLWC